MPTSHHNHSDVPQRRLSPNRYNPAPAISTPATAVTRAARKKPAGAQAHADLGPARLSRAPFNRYAHYIPYPSPSFSRESFPASTARSASARQQYYAQYQHDDYQTMLQRSDSSQSSSGLSTASVRTAPSMPTSWSVRPSPQPFCDMQATSLYHHAPIDYPSHHYVSAPPTCSDYSSNSSQGPSGNSQVASSATDLCLYTPPEPNSPAWPSTPSILPDFSSYVDDCASWQASPPHPVHGKKEHPALRPLDIPLSEQQLYDSSISAYFAPNPDSQCYHSAPPYATAEEPNLDQYVHQGSGFPSYQGAKP